MPPFGKGAAQSAGGFGRRETGNTFASRIISPAFLGAQEARALSFSHLHRGITSLANNSIERLTIAGSTNPP
jgi:hypothetical protein